MKKSDTTSEDEKEYIKFFNINKISSETGISKDKLYNNFNDKYHSLDATDKKQILIKIQQPVQDLFSFLGMEIKFLKQKA